MFGEKAGAERFAGALNQFVVTKLTGKRRNFWVVHTKGEIAVSILITELTKLNIKGDEQVDIVRDIRRAEVLTKDEWEDVARQQATNGITTFAWGSPDAKIELHKAMKDGGAASRILAYEKVQNGEM